MTRANLLVIGVPLLKKHMEENDVALSKKKAADIMNSSENSVYQILMYMEGAGIVKRVRRGISFYVLMDAVNEGRLEAVLDKSGAPRKHVPIPRRRRATIPRIRHRGRDEVRGHMASMRERTDSGEGPSALAIIGLPQYEGLIRDEVLPQEEGPVVVTPVGVLPEVDHGIIKVEPFGSVENISKGTRLLTRREARQLRSYLRGFEGREKVEGYKCIFVNLSALEWGKYGNIFYVSHGTNSWDRVHRVTLDDSIFRYQPLSSTERNMWDNWKAFDEALSLEPRYSRKEYEKILDAFIDSGNEMVEIMVEHRSAAYVKQRIKEIIADRGLEGEVRVSHVDKWMYLEKMN